MKKWKIEQVTGTYASLMPGAYDNDTQALDAARARIKELNRAHPKREPFVYIVSPNGTRYRVQ